MDEEYMALISNKTWEVVDRPSDRNVITSKWVFDTKEDEYGNILPKKAGFVARGFSQIAGIDYTEKFAPVVDPAVLRLSMAYAAANKKDQRMFDFNCAFLKVP